MDHDVTEKGHKEQDVQMAVHGLWESIWEDKQKVDKGDRAHLVKDVQVVDQLLFKRLEVDQVEDHKEG